MLERLHLPYTKPDLRRLEVSLINWIDGLGLLRKVPHRVTSLADIEELLRNGSLLCALVGSVLGIRMRGVFRDPRTDATCCANIRKSLEPLRRDKRMSQKHTCSEREIFEGDKSTLLGLLEDVHRLADGLPPRPSGSAYYEDGPYLGNTCFPLPADNRGSFEQERRNDGGEEGANDDRFVRNYLSKRVSSIKEMRLSGDGSDEETGDRRKRRRK